MFGLGVVARDVSGTLITGKCVRGAVASPLEAEAKGALLAMECIISSNHCTVVINTNSKLNIIALYDWLANKKLGAGYFVWPFCTSYGLGLLITYVALNLMDGHGQPDDLLYIVPFTRYLFDFGTHVRGYQTSVDKRTGEAMPERPSAALLSINETRKQRGAGHRDIAKVPKVMRCIDREREALLAFKQGLVDSDNLLSSWGSEAQKQDCCASWLGVYCDEYTGHVVKLDLHYHSLGGRISSQVGNLTHLQYLNLRYNYFNVKNLNSWLPRLSSLTFLDLSNSNLRNAYDWMEAINKLPKLTNLALSISGLPSPLIHSCTVFNINSSKSLAHVDLSYNQLTSSIFLWLSNYNASLVHLDLSHNQIEGGIPQSFSRLCNLQALKLSDNTLSGQLSRLVQTLMSTCPDQNSFEILDLSDNLLSGSIPNVTNFSSLKELSLSRNQLSGTIPESIGQMPKLENIDLRKNALEGVVSESHFSSLSRLTYLDLSFNSLNLNFNSNWVPPFHLDFIYLGSCMIGPHFPKWLQTQKNYSVLDISNTGISDILPSWFWDRLSHDGFLTGMNLSMIHMGLPLIDMDLSNNQIRGKIPNSRFEIPYSFLPSMNLSWNQLEGPIPSFLSKASSLDLSNNKLSELTSFLCPVKVSYLGFLDVSSINLYEELPDCWMHFEQLAFLDLSYNALFGKIPAAMGSLFSIQTLKINKNGFVGELPSSLKNCSRLVLSDVGENNLSGLIPDWLGVGLPNLAILILRSNHFYGSIPLQLCNLKHIQILDLSINSISGSIPKCFNNLTNLAEIGNLSPTVSHEYDVYSNSELGPVSYENGTNRITNMPSYQSGYYDDEVSLIWKRVMSKYKSTLGLVKSIHLSSNRIAGEIPNEITDLVGLVSLNLSRNNLTSQITPKFGKLASLQSLDLSSNQIYGGIPPRLLQIYGLGVLDLSNNNLSGKIPMGSQLQTYEPSSFDGNPLLCGIPLQQCPEEQPEEQPNQVKKKDGFITTGFYVSLALGFVVGFWGICGSLIFIKSWRYTYYKFLNYVYDWLYVRVALIRRRRMVEG
ncbi:receptor-like protein EIX2 [Malus domestica]|uniref:receptor-like protein EIX2 n=1 Tax=Malus domestica TaxID=3750 RepID=UPI0039756435